MVCLFMNYLRVERRRYKDRIVLITKPITIAGTEATKTAAQTVRLTLRLIPTYFAKLLESGFEIEETTAAKMRIKLTPIGMAKDERKENLSARLHVLATAMIVAGASI